MENDCTYNIVFLDTPFGELRNLTINGTDWFVAKDICTFLDMANTTMYIKQLDEDMRLKISFNNRSLNVISKDGVYKLCSIWLRRPNSHKLFEWFKEKYPLDEENNYVAPREEKHSVEQTPIEIALGIDEEGHTTANKLYDWLELNPTHYSRWIKRNLLENPFADNPKDYSPLMASDNLGKGNFAQDYLLSASFAKKLAMMTKSPRGEKAREYFIKVEEELAKKAKDEKEQENSEVSGDVMIMLTKMLEYLTKIQKSTDEKFSYLMDIITSDEKSQPVKPSEDATTKVETTFVEHNKEDAYTLIMDNRRYPVTATTISRDFGIDVRAFNTMLSMQGIIHKKDGSWEPTEEFKNCDIMQMYTFIDHSADKKTVNYKWTRKGNELVRDVLLRGYNIIPLCMRS